VVGGASIYVKKKKPAEGNQKKGDLELHLRKNRSMKRARPAGQAEAQELKKEKK